MRTIGNNPQLPRQTQAVASGAITGGKPVVVNSNGTLGVVATSSDSTAVGSPEVFESAALTILAATFDSNANKVVIAYSDNGNSSYGTAIVGTVNASNNTISFGSPEIFENASTKDIAATFDSNSNKVVIVYRDFGNSNYGTAVVGTVSGTDISFGSAVIFESANVQTSRSLGVTFDSNSNKVVIAYRDNGNSAHGTAIVGTVSGTSISFGSAVVFESASSDNMSATFDSNSNKVVIAYQDSGARGDAIVGTVSGTSISFGSATSYESGNAGYISTTFDSNANKVVVAYTDYGNSKKGKVAVGTVSGTSISFGSLVIFSQNETDDIAMAFDSSVNKVVIAYADGDNNNYGYAIEGTVSNTSISFGSAVVFESARAENMSRGVTFDSNAERVVIAYKDDGNNNYGTSVVFRASGDRTNLTTENYIGIAEGPVATGQPVTVNTKGAVDENQTSLTAGQTYFVQTDGTLGTSADDPSVVAGTAVTATKLIVKG